MTMISHVLMWLTIAGMAIILELAAPGLFFALSFAVGSCAAAICSYYLYDVLVQMGLFCIISAIMVMILRLYVAKIQQRKGLQTNVDQLIGRQAIVIKKIDGFSQPGLVKLFGDVWSAYELHQGSVDEGATVEVVAVKGCHLVVQRINS